MKGYIKRLLREGLLSESELYSSKEVANIIYNQLDYIEDNDWGFSDYHKYIKSYGDKWELVNLNPNELKYNEDFDLDTVNDYEFKIQDGENIEPIVVDKNNEIIDGNHRAEASRKMGINVKVLRPKK